MSRTTLRNAIVVVLLMVVSSVLAGDVVYNRYNIHYYSIVTDRGEQLKASYANYVGDLKGHGFIPANTAVELEHWRGGFAIKVVDTAKRIYFDCRESNVKMSVREYQKLIFSDEKVSLDSLSKKDKEGVKDGIVTVGMTKEGVKTSWGYPAKHRTPSLDENTWIYWRNRFRTIAVEFSDDKVVNVRR